MKILCRLLLKLNNVKNITPKKLIIIILVAFFGGHLGPDVINTLINSI
jgi:hypothetical protein